ncbi:hypothetical protein [Pseudodonghicola xiamenensis]|nr:hypothetical protein [Pseudodonghicola xiamenensis]
MLHRVPSVSDSLRREQIDLLQTRTDKGLLEVALASRLSGDTTWLKSFIREDMASVVTWRQQRGQLLDGYLGVAGSLIDTSDLDALGHSLREDRKRNAVRWRCREVWARHWWDQYWHADTDEEAYAAWVLLLQIVDRRAHAWMAIPSGMCDEQPRRVAHYRLNYDDLVRAMNKVEKKLDGEFLGRSAFDWVHPWLKRPDYVLHC